ncbi:MAG TPA: hypothetical protein VMU70_02615 [Candidatus Tyrphobacter sp.]|nr:hypothetical protein [Candidatus Tyrphobacter sp.]
MPKTERRLSARIILTKGGAEINYVSVGSSSGVIEIYKDIGGDRVKLTEVGLGSYRPAIKNRPEMFVEEWRRIFPVLVAALRVIVGVRTAGWRGGYFKFPVRQLTLLGGVRWAPREAKFAKPLFLRFSVSASDSHLLGWFMTLYRFSAMKQRWTTFIPLVRSLVSSGRIEKTRILVHEFLPDLGDELMAGFLVAPLSEKERSALSVICQRFLPSAEEVEEIRSVIKSSGRLLGENRVLLDRVTPKYVVFRFSMNGLQRR